MCFAEELKTTKEAPERAMVHFVASECDHMESTTYPALVNFSDKDFLNLNLKTSFKSFSPILEFFVVVPIRWLLIFFFHLLRP